MTVKQVEPLKFKGNKTWYLHKLSEKGAAAMKCDFPNGDDTFTETTLQAAIDELATNGGGGGSAESLIPKRVIYINPDKETAVGECYPTFAAAKTYIESLNTTEKFCIELPAGEFDEQITLDVKWTIHGNNTILTAPLASAIVFSELANSIMMYSIVDCTISAGFETVEIRTQADQALIPVYVLSNCAVTQLENNADEPDTYERISIIVMSGGLLNVHSCSSNGLKRCELIASCVEVFQLVANQGYYFFNNSYIAGDVTAPNSSYSDVCDIEYENCTFSSMSRYAIYGTVFKNCTFDSFVTRIKSSLDMIMSNVDIATHPRGSGNSAAVTISLPRDLYLRNTIIQSVGGVEGSPSVFSDAISTPLGPTWIINRPIVYSTDGGVAVLNMSNDPTGATHYGICKDLSKTELDVSNYMWFPMPVGE